MENAEKTKKMRLDAVNRGIEGIQNNSVWLASILIKFLAQGPVSFRIEAQILQYAYDHHIQRLDVGRDLHARLHVSNRLEKQVFLANARRCPLYFSIISHAFGKSIFNQGFNLITVIQG